VSTIGASKGATPGKTRSKQDTRRQYKTKQVNSCVVKSSNDKTTRLDNKSRHNTTKPNTRQEKAKQDMSSDKESFIKSKHDKITRQEKKSLHYTPKQKTIQQKTMKYKTRAQLPTDPVKIVYWNEDDDSEVDDWLLAKPYWQLVLPKGWVYAADLDPKELQRLRKI
jgi:hypothetical protein